MAGTVVQTHQKFSTVKKLTFDWASSTSGAATANTTGLITGLINRYLFIPDSGGTAPTSNYDVVVNDSDSQDVLQGKGANLSALTASDIVCGTTGNPAPIAVSGILSLSVTNAGNAKGGKVILYYR